MVNKTPTIDMLQAGLKATGMRGRALANNIANMHTSGYRRYEVEFEQLLARELARDEKVDLRKLAPKLYRPMNTPLNAEGNDVDIDHEVGQMVKNGAMYRTYMKMLGKMYQQIEAAISG